AVTGDANAIEDAADMCVNSIVALTAVTTTTSTSTTTTTTDPFVCNSTPCGTCGAGTCIGCGYQRCVDGAIPVCGAGGECVGCLTDQDCPGGFICVYVATLEECDGICFPACP